MREYQVRRTADCPTGAHVQSRDNPDDPTQPILETVDCDCPWLVIRESHPVPHVMVWPTAESVRRLIKEFDEGHFDQEGMPRRNDTRFMSPHVSAILELIQRGDIVGAAMRLLAQVTADQVTWSAETAGLQIRVPFDKGQPGAQMDAWLQLTFRPGEPIAVDRGPGDKFTGFREELWHTDHATPVAGYPIPADVSAQITEALAQAGMWTAAPEPVAGYHVPPVDELQQYANALTLGAADDVDEEDRFAGVVARGKVIELRRTAAGDVEATAVFPDGVRDLVGSVPLPDGIAIDPERIPGTVHGIRPHRYPRTAEEAETMRALVLGATPMPLDRGLLDLGPDPAVFVSPQEGDEHD